jgi:CreA protein
MQSFLTRLCLAALATIPAAQAAEPAETRIGDVSTTFRLLGANDKIVVDRYDDPRVENVSCYMSRAQTGGVAGSFGLATDPSRFSIACRATGPVTVKARCPITRWYSAPRPTGRSRRSG